MDWDLVVFDLDGVLVDVYSSWVWIHKHFKTSNDQSLAAYERGEIDDHEFMRRDIALWLAKYPELHIHEIRDIVLKIPLMPGIERLTQALKDAGIKLAIVSGGIDMVAENIAGRFGFDSYIANGLATDASGVLTGEGILRVSLRDKATPTKEIITALNADPRRSIAIGNSYIDVGMFTASALGIAFLPIDPEVAEQADIVINARDLTAVLEYL